VSSSLINVWYRLDSMELSRELSIVVVVVNNASVTRRDLGQVRGMNGREQHTLSRTVWPTLLDMVSLSKGEPSIPLGIHVRTV